jgi:hypothetical protein
MTSAVPGSAPPSVVDASHPPTAQLDPAAVYLSPAGRCCRLCPSESLRPFDNQATFIYHRKDGRPGTGVFSDGFVLARANWHLLRRLA